MIDHRPMSPRWCLHLLGCQRKGREAQERGESRDSCPYRVYNVYDTGPKNLTKQRRSYWHYGWDLAKAEMMESERKNISQPTAWWAAFEAAAKAEGVSLSEWLGECGKANLPAKVAAKLSERPTVGAPKRPNT